MTYERPLQHTAKLRAAKRSETGGFEQRGLSAWMPIPSGPLRTEVADVAGEVLERAG